MKVIDKLRAWHQDRKQLSMEKHEIDYVKRLAKKYKKLAGDRPDHSKTNVSTGSLRRMCKYILKTRPETRKSDHK